MILRIRAMIADTAARLHCLLPRVYSHENIGFVGNVYVCSIHHPSTPLVSEYKDALEV
jgi:hypothetical protein